MLDKDDDHEGVDNDGEGVDNDGEGVDDDDDDDDGWEMAGVLVGVGGARNG